MSLSIFQSLLPHTAKALESLESFEAAGAAWRTPPPSSRLIKAATLSDVSRIGKTHTMGSPDYDYVVVEDSDARGLGAPTLELLPDEDVQEIWTWLKPTEHSADSSEYKRHLHSYVTGTDIWTREPQYEQWMGPQNCGSLWLKAVPGAGKSVAAAHIVAHSSREPKTPVLYFFFRQIIINHREPRALLQDWLAQLLEHSPVLQRELKHYRDKGQKCESIPFKDLWHKIIKAIRKLPRVFCVADAIDEMSSGHEGFIKMLAELGKLQPEKIKVCLTSRPVPRIEKVLRAAKVNQVTLSPALLQPAVATYIEKRLASLAIPMPQDVSVRLQQELAIRSNGLFLHIKLLMDELLVPRKSDAAALLSKVASLPSGLSNMYTMMLQEHSIRSGVPQLLQVAILRWVTHSARPLRVLELAAIVDSLTTNELLEDVQQLRVKHPNTKAMIREACGPLIEILEDETVSIIHHSLTEYVVDSARNESTTIERSNGSFPTIDSLNSHREMAMTCLQTLTGNWAHDLEIASDAYYWGSGYPTHKYAEYPFLNYASIYWPHHVRSTSVEDRELFSLLDLILNPLSHHFQNWRYLRQVNFTKGTNTLHFAASQGFALYIKDLVQNRVDVNGVDADDKTPLHLAASSGYTEAVVALLDNGAKLTPDDKCGHTPLHLAAKQGHVGVVRAFLERGVDPAIPKIKRPQGSTSCRCSAKTDDKAAIRYAFKHKHGRIEIAMVFVPYLTPDDLSQAVFWAAEKERSDMIIPIFDEIWFDVNTHLKGENLAFISTKNHDIVLLEEFMKLGIRLEMPPRDTLERNERYANGIKCNPATTLLHVFATGCLRKSSHHKAGRVKSQRVLQILLHSGLDINVQDSEGQTPLFIATNADRWDREADVELIRTLLDCGADARTSNGHELLHLETSNDAILRTLLENGANVNARSSDSQQSPLHYCIKQDRTHDNRFKTLLEYGADCNAADVHGDTPLHFVTRYQSWKDAQSQIEILLSHGANAEARNNNQETPLHCMRPWSCNKIIVPTLVKAGIDINTRNIEGKTAVMQMSSLSNEPPYGLIDAMLASGADINSRDYEGRTFLHHLCLNTHSARMIPDIVKRGADAQAIDFADNNILHYLARLESAHGIEMHSLLTMAHGLGTDPNAKNHEGRLPLHIAAGTRPTPWQEAGLDAIKFFLGPLCNSGIDALDHFGNTAIHLAATLSNQRVAAIIANGADPSLVNYEGQTLLHIAARARESNTVGLITELFSSQCRNMIHYADRNGRTALHYACRSGSIESVKIFLEAGVDPNSADREALTPLCACAEFPDEEHLWRLAATTTERPRFIDAACLSPYDSQRPRRPEKNENNHEVQRLGSLPDDHFVGVRQIVRLLLGAEVSQQSIGSLGTRKMKNAKQYALERGCDIMVDELSRHWKASSVQLSPKQTYLERYFSDKFCDLGKIIASVTPDSKRNGAAEDHQANSDLFRALLETENEKGVLAFFERGGDLVAPVHPNNPLAMLIKYGFSQLLSKIGPEASVVSERMQCDDWDILRPKVSPPLHQACGRDLLNLDVLRVLVEEKEFDVNALDRRPHSNDQAPLHILAQSSNWWKSQGIAFLVDHGADVNIRDAKGNTPLKIAVKNDAIRNAEVLLRYGADSNIIAKNGMTCLNNAVSSPEMIGRLLAHGASVTVGKYPFIFEAINLMDLELVTSILETGVDLNVGFAAEKRTGRTDRRPLRYVYGIQYHHLDVVHPLHLAASKVYNNPDQRTKMAPIIKALLKHSADPLRECSPGHIILHELCVNEGAAEPFFVDMEIDLEHRDGEGNTFLLAACLARITKWPQSERVEPLEKLPSLTALLLQLGANIDATNFHKQNALHLLFSTLDQLGHRDPILLGRDLQTILAASKAVAIIDEPDEQGMTPLLQALHYYPPWEIGDFVNTLLDHGANAFITDKKANTVLHHTVQCLGHNPNKRGRDGPTETFLRFLELGMPINSRNNDGDTVLFVALRHNYLSPKGVEFYLERGAVLGDSNHKGENLLHVVAAKSPRSDCIADDEERSADVDTWKYLIERGLDPSDEDHEQRSAWDLAVAVGNTRVLGLAERGMQTEVSCA